MTAPVVTVTRDESGQATLIEWFETVTHAYCEDPMLVHEFNPASNVWWSVSRRNTAAYKALIAPLVEQLTERPTGDVSGFETHRWPEPGAPLQPIPGRGCLMGHTPGFPCAMENADHDGKCVTPIDPATSARLRAAMAHHARGDAIEFLGAPASSDRDSDGHYWSVDGIAIGGTVQDGQPWVDISFPREPDDCVVPEYVRQGPAAVMERWLLAGLAAVQAARAAASMEES